MPRVRTAGGIMLKAALNRGWQCSTMKQCSSRVLRLAFVLALGTGVPCVGSPARACSQGPSVIESSYPVPGATGVPTNVVLYAAGEQLKAEAFLLETESGVRVPSTVSRVLPAGFDIHPATQLAPNQRYVLRHPGFSLLAVGPSNTSVEFETGNGPANPAVLSPPELDGAALLNAVESPCPSERLCLEPGGSDSALFAATSFNNLSELSPGDLTAAYGNAFRPDSCSRVWRRDALGNRSDVVELCISNLQSVELRGDASSTTCDEYRNSLVDIDEPDSPIESDEPDSMGCALTIVGAPSSSLGVLAAAFVLFAVLGASVRRRS